jgi:beta-galactosidase
MQIGTAWYPEYYAESEWDRDLGHIAEAGITAVRFGEFAWSQIEPEPGRFDTAWMERALAAFERHGISAVIGTPTATPPIWLAEQHPETLPVGDNGRRMVFGARQHRCYNADAYRRHSEQVVDHLARTFGHHPAVIGWQIDNEIGGEAKACYCEVCGAAFRQWLKERYESIDELNRRWGTAFWSQTYQRFEQIPIPLRTTLQLMLKHNPSLMLEWMRFHSQVMVDFCHEQARVLRRHTAPGIPILTNYDAFDWGENIDFCRLFDGLDRVGFDLYSDQDDKIAFYCDLMHDVLDRPFWFMEYGTGSGKLASELDAIAASGTVEKLFFFKFRPFPWGQEQGTRALRSVTGAPTDNFRAIRDWTTRHRPLQGTSDAPPPPLPPRRVGIVYDFDSSWSQFLTGWSGIPADLTYPRGMIETVHRALYGHGERARFILRPRARECQGLRLLVLPWTIIHDPMREEQVLQHVREGGSVLMTQDVFLKNRDNVFHETLPRLYTEALGCEDFLDHRPAGENGLIHEARQGAARLVVIATKATLADWRHWFDVLLA